MNRKEFRIALILVLVICALLYHKYFDRSSQSEKQLASTNYIGCTVAKFLLTDIDTTQQIAPLFSGLGDFKYPVSTRVDSAQLFFDQGLRLAYAFNHAEAHRSFLEASRLDPESAMPYWGQAYALGPNINDPLPDQERMKNAFEAAQKAIDRLPKASKKEKLLIQALSSRYSADTTRSIDDLNQAYMTAMEGVALKYPDDPTVLTLYAESVMNTVPWNYWDKDGNPSPNISKAKTHLEKAIEIDPKHPGAHHYYIHMVELPRPELGVSSADILGSLMPSAGHIVHMPSHIYIRVGRYADAVEVNKKAILADEDYISQCYAQGMYPLAYYPHNIHFLWSSASLLGNSELALEAAKKTAEKVPVGEMNELHFLQHFASTPLLAYVRFGKWNDILTMPAPNAEIHHLKLIWHYARGMAFIRKNNIKEAREELGFIGSLRDNETLKTNYAVGFDHSQTIAALAYEIIAGELASTEKDNDKAIEHLTKAVEIEDQLVYNEPSAWHIPPRQNLGAVLLKAGKFEQAEAVFKKDLEKLNQNGWSLMGLYQSQLAQQKTKEAQDTKKMFDEAWQHADIAIETSVL
ncbi:MAG: hypothetical protein CML04_05675 [Pseudozobellia sp.]|nr:hypothetical protein [Pseudozobellia sp.]MBG47887.1 hypothetical protein [Pseudozobellia sp.]|tara:strand:+ start:931986 stop:933716 length:1731 start_codon:yes stop_codon:yes gene_type:complete